MPRKRVTQIFPFLLPLRKWQRKKLFYFKMKLDGNRYAREVSERRLPHEVFAASSLLLNRNSGFDIEYQRNKVHNLQLAARTLNYLVIKPKETFSFWQLVRHADDKQPYKDGLILRNGEIVGAYGGGLCQLSNLLFWMFLHTPMSILERHGHAVESFPPTTEELPCGTDATVSEGWLDLKVWNNTNSTFQIVITFDEDYMYGQIFSDCEVTQEYEIFNGEIAYYRKQGKIYQHASVDCVRTDKVTGQKEQFALYQNICEIGYELPDKCERNF